MRIIKFKYRHTEEAHWGGEEWAKKSREERGMVWIKEQWRNGKKGAISDKGEKTGGKKVKLCHFEHGNM